MLNSETNKAGMHSHTHSEDSEESLSFSVKLWWRKESFTDQQMEEEVWVFVCARGVVKDDELETELNSNDYESLYTQEA